MSLEAEVSIIETNIRSGRRLAIKNSDWLPDWYISWSPRNCNQNAEGPWSEWVELAKAILAEDERRRAP
jgi:hypothetical protein